LGYSSDDPAGHLVREFTAQTGVDQFDLAVVLGSGWQEVAALGTQLGVFNYHDWPCFPAGQVPGHSGCLIATRYASWNVLFFSGRFHCYQGLIAYEASFPIRLAEAFGCPRVLLTCATGGINEKLSPGDFMLVDDHVNFMGDNPLRGLPGDTFVDMSALYESGLYDRVLENLPASLSVQRGNLAAMSGPCYETPAEVRFLAGAGADVVSMSTVPEAIMARFLKMRVAAIAFVANYAAGISDEMLNHQDVLACSSNHAKRFPQLVQLVIEKWQSLEINKPD
jgi:purine-nucleoside phosphorylase